MPAPQGRPRSFHAPDSASARYRSVTPTPPANPAAPPQTRSRAAGVASGNNGRLSTSSVRPQPCGTPGSVHQPRRARRPAAAACSRPVSGRVYPGNRPISTRAHSLSAWTLGASVEPGACPWSAASARLVAACATIADRPVRVAWARAAAHRRAVSGHCRPRPRAGAGGPCAFTRYHVVRGGGVMRCAGRRVRPCGAAGGLVPPAPVARDTRRVGRRRRAVPAH